MGDKSGIEWTKHTHQCAAADDCDSAFECDCPDPQSTMIDALDNGWKLFCDEHEDGSERRRRFGALANG